MSPCFKPVKFTDETPGIDVKAFQLAVSCWWAGGARLNKSVFNLIGTNNNSFVQQVTEDGPDIFISPGFYLSFVFKLNEWNAEVMTTINK